jgi:uncharacterized SAM-binding protein YcdF (DUF218 family)
MFLFKKLVGTLLTPLSLCLVLLLAGLALLWGTGRHKTGKILVGIGTLLLILASYPYLPQALLSPLEQSYLPLVSFDQMQSPGQVQEPIKWIVVLGGDMDRTLEGLRLFRLLPGVKIIITGGPIFGSRVGAMYSARICLNLGIKPEVMVLETGARDTEDEARLVRGIVGQDRLILVTSAFHMPRAMALFKKQGLDPVPAPTGFLLGDTFHLNPWLFLPSAENLRNTELAVHEYLGLAWAWLRGKI